MRIYVSHSSHYDFENKLYAPIEKSGLGQEFEFILPHKNTEELFDVRGAIERAEIDLVLAETSYPSTGQGIELAWFHASGIPIECVYLEDSVLPKSLKLLTNKFFDYETSEDLVDTLKLALLGHV